MDRAPAGPLVVPTDASDPVFIMVRTFFDGSAASAATALLGLTKNLSPDEAEALMKAIRDAEERG